MTATVLAVLRRAVDGIDGERFTPPATMLAVGVAGIGAAPDLFRTPVGTLTAMVVTVAGVRLALLPFGHTSPRPSIPRLLFSALATAVSRVLNVLGVSAQIALLWLLTGVLTGMLLAVLGLCWLVFDVVSPAPRTRRPTGRTMVAVPASACAALEVIRAARAADVTATGALDWLGDDPGPRAAAQEILRSLTPPEDR
jgi:hypothetical protein